MAADVVELILIGVVALVVVIGLLAYFLGKARGQVKGMKERTQTIPSQP